MSVLFLPPSAGAASVPDASETVSGKIRIATSAEATAGTNDLTAMTPAKTKSVVDAAVVGGVTYQGTFDASSPADLSNATKGDLYIISVAGTYQGQTWAVGDHLLINADMGGTLDPAKIDKVDNTDSVTSVAGRTGAVTLSTADISGLATVASTGAYSDLTGTPTLGTAAAEDVGTSAGNVVQLNGSAQLPAVDGSLLTGITASVAALNDIGDVSAAAPSDTNVIKYNSTSGDWESGAVAYSEVTGTPTLGTAAAEDVGTSAGNVVQLDGSARLPAVDGSQLTNLPSGASTLGALTDVTLTSVADGQFLKYDSGSSAWVNSDSGLYAYYSFSTTSTLAAPAQPQTLVVSLSSSLSQTLTLPTGSNDFVGTTISLANLNSGEWTIAAASGNYIRGLSSAPTLAQNQTLILALASFNTWLVVAYEEQGLGSLADVDVTGAVATNVLKYDGTDWVDGAVAYSEITGTPTLGTAAALDVGTSANNIVQLDGSARLPAVDGSQLTNLPTGGSTTPNVTSATPGATYTISTSTGIEEAYLLTPSTACAVTIPTASSATSGYKYQIKNLSANTVTISPSSGTIDGSASFDLSVQYANVTLLSDGSNWFVI